MAEFIPTVMRDETGFLTLDWPTDQRTETMVSRAVMAQMVDDLNRLRAAGDALAAVVNDEHRPRFCEMDCPSRTAVEAWEEARRG